MDNGASSYRRFISGDKNGLGDIVREYSDGMILYINSVVQNICIAEEIMEEVFVEIALKKPKYSGKSSFKTWLFPMNRTWKKAISGTSRKYSFIRRYRCSIQITVRYCILFILKDSAITKRQV